MADSKISALPAATTPLAGTEVLPIVQGGVTDKVSVANLTAGRDISALSATLSNGNLVVGTAGKGITTSGAFSLGFGTNNAVNAMTIDSSGNFGLGTATPAYRFDFKDASGAATIGRITSNTTGNTTVIFENTNTGGSNLAVATGALGHYLFGAGSLPLVFGTNSTERFRVKETGSVRYIPLAAAPAAPEAGEVYYDSSLNKLRCYNGTIWNDLF